MRSPRSKVRSLGEERQDVAIICDRGADVALLPLSMADQWEGELEYNAKTKLQDAQGSRIPAGVRKVEKFPCEPAHTLLWKAYGTWLGNQQQTANVGE